jgi:Do/DeqQ family serine protease
MTRIMKYIPIVKKLAIYGLFGTFCSLSSVGIYRYFTQEKQPVIVNTTSSNIPNHLANYQYTQENVGLDFTYAAEVAMPAVVHIKSTTTTLEQTNSFFFPPSPFFEDFFGPDIFGNRPPQQPRQRKQQGSGSGVIIANDGYIVTNNHVIQGADELEVTLFDKRTYKATVIGTDPSTDIALIKIEENDLPTVAIANSDEVKVGQWVMAVGNPFNLESTVTAGIVSAKGRNINILRENYAIESFIQTDAAVNPGNSGGALVNLKGELIGINTAIASPTGAYAGYSFAVPVNLVRKVTEDLKKFGVVQRAVLGISIKNIDEELAKKTDVAVNTGVYIDSVFENSTASEAGLKKGDVITAINGKKIKTVAELQEAVAAYRPGEKATITYIRKSKEKEVTATLKNKSGSVEVVKKESSALLEKLGVVLEDLSKDEKKKTEIENGVKVKELKAGILRNQTTMREGFIITKIDGQTVKDRKDVERKLEGKSGGVMIEGIYPNSKKTVYYAFGLN